VTVVLCKEIANADDIELVNFHPNNPNRNIATLSLSKGDFINFLNYVGCPVIWEDCRVSREYLCFDVS